MLRITLIALSLASFSMAQSVPGYLNFAGAEQQITAFARQNPAFVKLESIGVSAGARKIHVLSVAIDGAIPPASRPAIFLGANLAGFHNAGTQAALAFAERLIAKKDDPAVKKLLETRTFYIAPILNPDAHDAFFTAPKSRRSTNAGSLDRDRDGLSGEDGPNDLNNDGRITQMRIDDPAGEWMADEKDPRLLRRADPLKGEKGKYKLVSEGSDDDKDGQFNEDSPGGYVPSKNFAHAWPDNDPEAGPWTSAHPESKAILDFFLRHRNIALAFVYGPANNLLEMPRGAGARSGDVGGVKVKVPRQMATATGLDPDKEYTIDEVYDVVKDTPMGRQQNLSKEQLAQFLGGGPATSPDAEDLKYYQSFADDYKKILDKAGLDSKRAGAQSNAGGLQNWLYYQHSVMAIELDVWGIPKKSAPKPAASVANDVLTLDKFEKMTSAEATALDDEKLGAFLKSINAPAMATTQMVKQGLSSGRMTPAQMVTMMRAQGARPGAPAASPASGPTNPDEDVIAYIDTNAKDAFVAWTSVTLPDGRKAEVGGVDPFLAIAPPADILIKAADAHSDAILSMSAKLAEVSIVNVEAKALGSGIYKVTATAINNGFLPTATRLQVRTRSFLPARLEISLPSGASLVQGSKRSASERITGSGGTHQAEWLVNAAPGAKLTFRIFTQNAGQDSKEITLP